MTRTTDPRTSTLLQPELSSPSGDGCERTILFDVTELVVMDLRTGIQRVARELLEHGLAGAARGRVMPVIAVGGNFHPLSEAGWTRIRSPGAGACARVISHQRGVPLVVRLIKRASEGNPWLYNRLQRLYFGAVVRRRSRGLYLAAPVRPSAEHQLVLADSFWGGASTLKAAARAQAAGAEVSVVAYDLIPLSHPQYCDARLSEKFPSLMRRAMALSDRVLAISQDCEQEFCSRYPGTEVSAFRLGHDLRDASGELTNEPGSGPEGGLTKDVGSRWPAELWSGEGRVFVIVGSIEPRKGHKTVLDAFERRWSRGEPDKLMIIGKVGWQVDELMERIDGHEQAGRRLFHTHDATDAMLAEALRRAHAGIIASYVEGFGLPLAEGMSAGLPMIASDITVFHEIAGDRALYFAPGDVASLDEAIDALHSGYAERRRAAAEFTWPTWSEAAAGFFAKVEATVAQ